MYSSVIVKKSFLLNRKRCSGGLNGRHLLFPSYDRIKLNMQIYHKCKQKLDLCRNVTDELL